MRRGVRTASGVVFPADISGVIAMTERRGLIIDLAPFGLGLGIPIPLLGVILVVAVRRSRGLEVEVE